MSSPFAYRTPDQIMADIKKEDENILNATRRRNERVRELRALAETARQFADTVEGVDKNV